MAQILDKQGLQHYANKMCNADNRKVGSKNLPTALNEIDIAIDGFKTLFETEYGTPVNMELENNENVFSIGTGTNIDKKDDVENSFTDVELNGNSLVNLFTTTQNFASFGKNIVRNGFVITLSNTSGWSKTGNRLNLKPNTTYYAQVTCENKSNITCGSYIRFSHDLNHSTGINMPLFPANSITTQNCVFTTNDTGLVLLSVERGEGPNESIFYDIILLEGDWTNKPIPQYFEGLKSVGEKEDGNHKISILSVGKNLVNNIVNEWEVGSIDGVHGTNTTTTTRIRMKNFATLPKKEGYLSCKYFGDYKLAIRFYNKKFEFISGKDKPYQGFIEEPKIKIPNSAFYYKLICASKSESEIVPSEISNCMCQLELGETTPVSYTNFGLNKKEISLNEPLRGLPNGVKDTIEKINGEWKIVRRCSEVVFNGSEPWALLSDTDKEKTIGFSILKFLPLSRYGDKYKMVVCDRFPSYKHNLWKKDYEGITTENNINDIIDDTQLQIIISKSKLSTKDIAGFKQWLSQNPTKVIYQLDIPIIEDISPITLQCWKNGTISINEVLPVETTHTVALNKSAQIQKNIEELTLLRNRVETLEKQYNNSTLNQAYELELLRLDMQLNNII